MKMGSSAKITSARVRLEKQTENALLVCICPGCLGDLLLFPGFLLNKFFVLEGVKYA